ncbi:hypothetical protein ACNF49_30575 [Actinomadura sp. ATCC 39365]
MRADITLATPVRRTARVLQLQGTFDVPLEEKLTNSWSAHLPVEERRRNVGLLVGPSGAGKTTLAKALWPGRLVEAHVWGDRALVDDFPKGMGIKDIGGLLTAVGLSSPPAWLRPYRTLSNGEAFRAGTARALAEQKGLVAVGPYRYWLLRCSPRSDDDHSQAEWALALWAIAAGDTIEELFIELEQCLDRLPSRRRRALRIAALRLGEAGLLAERSVTATTATGLLAEMLVARAGRAVTQSSSEWVAPAAVQEREPLASVARTARWLKVDQASRYR